MRSPAVVLPPAQHAVHAVVPIWLPPRLLFVLVLSPVEVLWQPLPPGSAVPVVLLPSLRCRLLVAGCED